MLARLNFGGGTFSGALGLLGVEGAILLGALHLRAPAAGIWLIMALALWAWRRAYQRFRTISDTPTDRIASTAQGYTELLGRGWPLEGRARVFNPVTGLPCLWYRANYYAKNGGGSAWSWFWTHLLQGQFYPGLLIGGWGAPHAGPDESDASFLLDDGSGAVAAVDPDGAEILVRRQVHYREDTRIELWCLHPGDLVYVIGDFVTLGSIAPDLDTRRQIGELLEFWKADHRELLRRFDLDGDGKLSHQEWALARAAARREVLRIRQQVQAAPEAHIVRQPRDGQPYLIADREPRALARRFRLWAIVHGAVFIAAAAAQAWLHARGGGAV